MLTRITPRPTALRVSAGLSGIALAGAYALVAPGIAGADTPLQDGCNPTGDTVTCTYTAIGAEQAFTVPDGVTSIDVTAIGGHGGAGTGSAKGGRAAEVSGNLTVDPGDQLFVEVGGNGGDAIFGGGQPPWVPGVPGQGGWNGGGDGGSNTGTTAPGGGGGATDLRTISRISDPVATSLESRLIIAGGGGGGGNGVDVDGGGAGQAGHGQYGGGAGTQTQGGDGGTEPGPGPGAHGADGQLGSGGAGEYGGGGGGGLYGGGGGGGVSGGGGGSSLVPDGGTGPTLANEAPSVTIVYTTPDDDSGETECTGSMCMIVGSISASLADFDA